MANITLNTELFGTISFDSEDGLWEYYTIEIDGKEINTRLDIESYLDPDSAEHIEDLLNRLPQMLHIAKAELVERYPEDETVRVFVDFQMEEIDEDSLLECFEVDALSEITPEAFLNALQLCGISIDGNAECAIDLCLDPDVTDALLVVRFDQDLEITDIAHES